MNEAYLSTVSSVGIVVAACAPLAIQFVVRFAIVVVGIVALVLSFQRRRMWIAFTLLVDVAYLCLELAFRGTLVDAEETKERGVIANVRKREKPKIVKRHAMHHGIWAATLVFGSIVSFGYGRFLGSALLGTMLVCACVVIWVPPNFRSKFSEFDPTTVAVKHRATIVSLVAWRIVSACGAVANLRINSFWCYAGFVVALPLVVVAVKSRSVYFDVSVQIETWVLAMLVLVSNDQPADPPPIAFQWIVLAAGVVFCAYTVFKLAREYPNRVLA